MPAGSSSASHSGEATAPTDNLIDEPYTYEDDHNEEALDTDCNVLDDEHQSSTIGLHTWVEEVEDEYDVWQCFICSYPEEVATEMGQACTMFEAICATQEEKGLDMWGPFKDGKEWELVRWLMRHVGKSCIEEFTDLSMVHEEMDLSISSTYRLMKVIDELPQASQWTLKMVKVKDNLVGVNGKHEEEVELWM
ncbi:hypothetical protein SCLCIDRAFT_34076 [Scleroderma citrinum Foug A]|uniref:Uncharacterized protein n=1 Tax=Scleroderma citrinum Foug A TaxID=1036808 RepID=A0A0C2YLU1_9AGAM|nr:hypothetical protein SCLCIDRAFT_34076 [Scleroderma citrinum Foug A]